MLPHPFLPWWPALPKPVPASTAAPLAAGDVLLAVVIPAHGQPGLLPEAIESVLTQQGAPPLAAVVVDDGCPDPETSRIASAYATAHPGRVLAVRQRNAGLSAARNTGIEVALASFPACRAVYFLDADNRVAPHLLARADAALQAAPAGIGWVYPDFDMFGLPMNGSGAGPYALLAQLVDNLCEAGSLVRRSLLQAGLRFDESFRAGFEDWDFWLQAAGRGFRGQHLPNSGFQYRRRPESMLAEAERQRPILAHALRRKHAGLYHPRNLLRLEAAEMPRFAWFRSGEPGADLLLDPTRPATETLTLPAARERLLAAAETPSAAFFPPVCLFAEPAVLETLARFRLLHGLFWQADLTLRDAQFLGVELLPGAEAELRQEMLGGSGGLAACQLVFARTRTVLESIRDPSGDWLDSLRREAPRPATRRLRLTLPDGERPPPPATLPPVHLLAQEVGALARTERRATALPRQWRSDFRRPRHQVVEHCQHENGLGVSLPLLPAAGRRDIALLVPVFSFGGVEKVVLAYAEQFRAAGWRPHLFLVGSRQMALTPEARAAFESITLVHGLGEDGEDWSAGYFGGGTPSLGNRREAADVLGLLAGMHAVLNTHSFAGHALMARLRRLGVRTLVGLHLVERSDWGQPSGNPHHALAYEHAYDGFVVISQALRDWCLGQGIPGYKLHLVRNAPGYATTAAQVAEVLAARRHRAPGPLRVLYLGRLDQQKGMDRLAALVAAHPTLDWLVVGGTVMADTGMAPDVGVAVEPPVSRPRQLDALYAWADAVLLPSRFEGVPLTVLEAQRLGCVVIATEVGAVAEIIADGADGVLVGHDQPEAAIVAAFGAALTALADDPALLARLSQAAAARVADAGWAATMRDFLTWLAASCPLDAET